MWTSVDSFGSWWEEIRRRRQLVVAIAIGIAHRKAQRRVDGGIFRIKPFSIHSVALDC